MTGMLCPTCGLPAKGHAFARSSEYLRCIRGHVWAWRLESDSVPTGGNI